MCLYYVIFVDISNDRWHCISGNTILSTKNIPQDYVSSNLKYTYIGIISEIQFVMK